MLCQQLAVIIWYQVILCDRAGEHFFFAVADDLREALIDFMDAPTPVGDSYAESIGLYERAQLLFAVLELFLQLLALGRITEVDHHSLNRWITQQIGRCSLHPAP